MRKSLNKIIIASLILINGIFFSSAYWLDNDCNSFAILTYHNTWSSDDWFKLVDLTRWTENNKYSNFLTVDQQLKIIDKDSLNTAILNLKKYCCEKNLWTVTQETCSEDRTFYNNNSLDSPYLFDHLFDVIMRRLIWLTWDTSIYEKSKMSVDNTWAKRRGRISEQAESVSWSTPQIIMDEYQKFWILTPEYDISEKINTAFWGKSTTDFLLYVSWKWWKNQHWESESEQVAKTLQKYEKWSLYDRYNNACALSEYFYALLIQSSNTTEKVNTINNLSRWVCRNAVNRQIANETNYVKLIIQRSSNRFLDNYVKWYFGYLHDRTLKLKDIEQKSTDRFLDVVRAVPQLIKKCVH